MGLFDPPERAATDQYGRYMLNPDGRGQQAFTRSTTMARVLDDEYNLRRWELRCAVHGIAQRPDLIARAAVTPVDQKKDWKEILDAAATLSGSDVKRNTGTAFHQLRAIMSDPATDVSKLPPEYVATWSAYVAELKAVGLIDIESARERRVADTRTQVAGTMDGLVWDPKISKLRVMDCKGGSIGYPHGFAVQLANYANAEWVEGPNGWQRMADLGDLDTSTGIIVHVEVSMQPVIEIYEIDLVAGYQAVVLAFKVREWRKRKDLLVPYAPAHARGAGETVPQHNEFNAPPVNEVAQVATPAEADDRHEQFQQAIADTPNRIADAVAVDQMHAVATMDGQNATVLQFPQQPAAVGPAEPHPAEQASEKYLAGTEAAHVQRYTDDPDELLKKYPTKAGLQQAARTVGVAKVERTRANLAKDMVAHPNWPAMRDQILDVKTAAKTTINTPVAPAQPPTVSAMVGQELPGTPGPEAGYNERPAANPFGNQVPPPPAAPEPVQLSPEDAFILRVSNAASRAELAQLWDEAQATPGLGWTARMQQAAEVATPNLQ